MSTGVGPSTSLGMPLEDDVVPGPGLLVSRSLVAILGLLLVAAATWSVLAEVDVVVRARGQIDVPGETIELTPPEAALVVEVPVRVGDAVRKGDVLLRMQGLRWSAEAARLESEIRALDSEASRHSEMARSARAAMTHLRQSLANARSTEQLLASEAATYRGLVDAGVAAPLSAQEKERETIDAATSALALESEISRAAREASERERQAFEARERKAGLEAKRDELRQTEGHMTLVAPADGIVSALAVRHPGRVADNELPAVILSPTGQPIQATLRIANASMRNLREGAPVRVRVEAYPFQDHGHVEGVLERIEPTPGEDGSYRAWVSELRAAEEAQSLRVEALRPGLLVDADIVIERRRILDLLLRPLRRLDDRLSIEE